MLNTIKNLSLIPYFIKNENKTKDLNEVLAKNGTSLDKMLKMSVRDYKANGLEDVMTTLATWFGQEWVNENVIMPEILERIRQEPLLQGAFVDFILPKARTVTFIVRGWQKRMKALTETRVNPSDRDYVAWQVEGRDTPEITLNTAQIIETNYLTDTLIDKSVIDAVEYIYDALAEDFIWTINDTILNGDTATTWNINWTIANARDNRLLFDWARKVAIDGWYVEDAGWNLDETVVRDAVARLGEKWVKADNLKIVVDSTLFNKLKKIASNTEYNAKAWIGFYVDDARILRFDWIEVVYNDYLSNATEDGTVSDDVAENTTHQMLIIHMPSVLYGAWQDYEVETSRYAEDKKTWFTASGSFAIWFNNIQNALRPTAPVVLIVNI